MNTVTVLIQYCMLAYFKILSMGRGEHEKRKAVMFDPYSFSFLFIRHNAPGNIAGKLR